MKPVSTELVDVSVASITQEAETACAEYVRHVERACRESDHAAFLWDSLSNHEQRLLLENRQLRIIRELYERRFRTLLGDGSMAVPTDTM